MSLHAVPGTSLRPELQVCLSTSEKREVWIYFSFKCLPFLLKNLVNCLQTENLPFVWSDIGEFSYVAPRVVFYKYTLTRNSVCVFLFSPTGKLLFERLLREILSNNQSARVFMLVDH